MSIEITAKVFLQDDIQITLHGTQATSTECGEYWGANYSTDEIQITWVDASDENGREFPLTSEEFEALCNQAEQEGDWEEFESSDEF
jgi:hypothetical protein